MRLFDVTPDTYVAHRLHESSRSWPETNCYVDLWIEVLSCVGQPPEAALGFTLTQDFEGDQFTFFKVPPEDLETLFGIRVAELAVFDRLEDHVATQLARGRLTLVEMDSFYLPDTRGITYREAHSKTTVGINELDVAGRTMTYFHNAGFFRVEGDDFDGLFGRLPHQREHAERLLPYTEFAKFPKAALREAHVRRESERLLAVHWAKRPVENPMLAYRQAFPDHLHWIAQHPPAFFHDYAFNTWRQFGANFELLAGHLDWLGGQHRFRAASAAARRLSEGAKIGQFQLARAVMRGKPDALLALLETLAADYDTLMSAVAADLT